MANIKLTGKFGGIQIEWVPWWWKVAYLIINDKVLGRIKEVINVQPSEKFQQFVMGHTRAYIEKGVMPPDAIAPAILNLADDLMAGRSATLRAGDYVMLQNFAREQA